MFAGGVDVAADVEAVLGGVVAGQPPGDFLLGFRGTQSGLADVVRGPHAGVGGESQDVGFTVAAEFEHVPAGMLFRAVPGAGDAGNAGECDGDGAAELQLEGFADGGGDRVQALVAGLVAGVDQLAERVLRLGGPDRSGVGFRAVLQVTQQVLDAGLVAGDVLPRRVEVVAVPVGDRDPGEIGEDPEIRHGLQRPGAEAEQGEPLGERAVHELLLPGRPGPQRGLIEPHDPGRDEQRLDQLHGPGCHRRSFLQAGVDEPRGHLRAGHVGQQQPAPLHRDVLEDQQVDSQRAQPRPDGDRGVRDAGRAGRRVGLPARAPGLVQVMLDRLSLRLGDLFLLAGPRDAEIGGITEVRAARAGALRVIVEGVIRHGPGHRRPRRPRLLAPVPLLRGVAFCLPPLLAGRLAARRVIP